jgi:hypothetical protein
MPDEPGSWRAGPPEDRGEALRAYWLSPLGLVMLAATGLALAIRLYLLTRLRYLTGITEYDDGVYLGGAVSLISGILPYHGFAFVQPPGILLLMAPAALLAKVFAPAPAFAMAVARLLTVGASAACVALTGALVRHRGAFVTLVACGALAVYPDDITSAHTLLLEPWMNLLVLAGARVAFRDGRLAAPRRLLWAGVLLGLAGVVKYWAVRRHCPGWRRSGRRSCRERSTCGCPGQATGASRGRRGSRTGSRGTSG